MGLWLQYVYFGIGLYFLVFTLGAICGRSVALDELYHHIMECADYPLTKCVPIWLASITEDNVLEY